MYVTTEKRCSTVAMCDCATCVPYKQQCGALKRHFLGSRIYPQSQYGECFDAGACWCWCWCWGWGSCRGASPCSLASWHQLSDLPRWDTGTCRPFAQSACVCFVTALDYGEAITVSSVILQQPSLCMDRHSVQPSPALQLLSSDQHQRSRPQHQTCVF